MEQRLNNLEAKYAYQDDLVNELNIIVAEQQKTIDMLIKEIRNIAESVSQSSGQTGTNLQDELPPHY